MDDDFGKRFFSSKTTTNLPSPRSDNYQKIKKKTCVFLFLFVCVSLFISLSVCDERALSKSKHVDKKKDCNPKRVK